MFKIQKDLQEHNIRVYPDVENHEISDEELENNKNLMVIEHVFVFRFHDSRERSL